LYFPYVNVPQSAWFTQVLLYWDRAASIVPRALEQDDSVLSRYMRELRDARLLEFVDPDGELWQHDEAFFSAFFASVDARSTTGSAKSQSYTRIHTGKMGWRVFSELEDRGLARHDGGPEWEPWWLVEPTTADMYMSYLAGALCGRGVAKGDAAYPVTDTQSAMAAFSAKAGDLQSRLRDLRYTAIMQALPVPATALPVDEIQDFKQRFADQLTRLRRHLDSKLVDIAALEDAEHRELKARLAVDEIRDEVKMLREQMQKRNWPRIVLVGLGGVVGAALAAVSGLVTAGTSTLALGLAVGGGLVSTAGPGYQVVEMIRSPAFDKNAPVAYAALVPQ
jgi:hypothetical protein